MNRTALRLAMIQATLLTLFLVGMARHWWPLGVPGQWEWLRIPASTPRNGVGLIFGGGMVVALAALAVLGARSLARRATIGREAAWIGALGAASILGQAVVQEGAPPGYGLAKWIIALRNEGSSGYEAVALRQMPGGLAAFLQDYPRWIKGQDSLHIGTHPPGLFVVARLVLDLTSRHPDLARAVIDHAPGSAEPMIRAIRASDATLTRAEAAALVLMGVGTLVASALTVLPLYLLVRASRPAPVAWAAAVLWPLVPSANLFQPTADTAFPLLATGAMAAAAWGVRAPRPGWSGLLAAGAGLLLAVGMELTLAFLAVGVVVATVLVATPQPRTWPSRLLLVVGTGLGFGLATGVWWGITGANPGAVWWVNQANHAGFYLEYPRSRLAWTLVNPVETAVGLGLATAVFVGSGGGRPRQVPTTSWGALAVLVVLTLSGRSLSEVARLWLPFYPAILAAGAVGWEWLGARPVSLGVTVGLVGLQTLALQTMIQVVYPI